MTYKETVNEKFNKLPEFLRTTVGDVDFQKSLKELGANYGADLEFVIKLILTDELSLDDLSEYLSEAFNLEPESSEILVQEIRNKILEPLNGLNDLRKEDVPLDAWPLADRRELINSIFTEKLVETIAKDNDYLSELNLAIFKTFQDDETFENKIIEIFYLNQEVLTSKPLVIEEKLLPPTVANWLKDFIKENGSDLFNAVVLSRYLADSLNPKNLDEAEKKKLRKVLRLYRNLVFFPESMKNIPEEKWEVIPIDEIPLPEKPITRFASSVPAASTVSEEKVSGTIKKEEPKKIVSAKPKLAVSAAPKLSSLPVPAVASAPLNLPTEIIKEEVPIKNNVVENEEALRLEELLSGYAKNTLEYKAIMEEIKKLKKNK